MKRLIALLSALLPLLGCHTYAETSLDGLSTGLQARVRLDEEGFGRVLNPRIFRATDRDR